MRVWVAAGDRQGGWQAGEWRAVPHHGRPLGAEQTGGGSCGTPGGTRRAGWALACSSRYVGAEPCGGRGHRWAGEPGTSCPLVSTGLRPSQAPRVGPVRTPRLQAEPRVTLPLDINNYPMAKFVRCHFKVSSPGQRARSN